MRFISLFCKLRGFFFTKNAKVAVLRGSSASLTSRSLQILKNNGSNGYLVGDSLTFADIGLLEVLLTIKDYYEPEVFEDFPEIEVM